jgi:hypothetical protein
LKTKQTLLAIATIAATTAAHADLSCEFVAWSQVGQIHEWTSLGFPTSNIDHSTYIQEKSSAGRARARNMHVFIEQRTGRVTSNHGTLAVTLTPEGNGKFRAKAVGETRTRAHYGEPLGVNEEVTLSPTDARFGDYHIIFTHTNFSHAFDNAWVGIHHQIFNSNNAMPIDFIADTYSGFCRTVQP